MPDAALQLVLALQLLAGGVMLGVIWMVQLIVYPAFAHVHRDAWRTHHDTHARRITYIVLPAMAVELCAAVWLVVARPAGIDSALIAANAALIVLLWGTTAFVATRYHRALGAGWDADAIAGLVRANWIRTVLWSARAAVAAALVLSCGGGVR
ncbi:MAG: hypothetical protein H7287_12525 [Thermoleophilia bacterium]|nr:hypothetical protein [Thermoleophilia bacterium]